MPLKRSFCSVPEPSLSFSSICRFSDSTESPSRATTSQLEAADPAPPDSSFTFRIITISSF